MSAVEFEVSLDALTEAMNCSWPKSAGELIGADGHAADGEETGHDAGMIKGGDRTGRSPAPKDQLPWSFDFVRGLPVTDETGSSGVGGGNSPHDSTTTMAVADGEQWCPDWAKPPLPKASGGPPPPLVTAQLQPVLDWGAWPTAAADGDDLFAPPKPAAEGEAEVASFPLTDPHACVAFGCKAIKLISRCQEALELAPDATHGPHGKLLGEIHELKKKFYGPAMMRAAARHRRFSLASASKRVLKAWFDEHLDSPYPTPKEKSLLARSAGLSIKQVNDWFTNYRKRHWEQELVKAQALDFDDHSASSGSS